MRVVVIACAGAALLLAAAGCGSSSSSGSGAGSSTPASAATTATTGTTSLKAIGTPKYGKPSSSAPVKSGTVTIAYRNIAIQPDTLRVRVGTRIVWTNYDSIEHNVTSEGGPQSFSSKDFGEGATFAIVATKPGLIHYQCTIHPASMNGTIEVVR
jgi:plastocyanin